MRSFSWSGIHASPDSLLGTITVLLWMLTCIVNLRGADKPEELDPRLQEFAKAKQQQARELAESLNLQISSDVWKCFDLFRQGNWMQASNAFSRLKKRNAQYEGSTEDPSVGTAVWQPLMEVEMLFEAFYDGDPKYARAFGDDIIGSIPPGSIYFGGTDAGRGLVTGLMRSHIRADPFFVITQNALADANYLNYLRKLYGERIYIPSESDSTKAFQDYLTDAQRRLQQDKLKPGEDVRVVGNRVQVSGQVAVMSINGLLAELIFKQNPEREFYVEESFPLDWMYPHLVPHKLILKIERQPFAALSKETVQSDQKYWTDYCGRLIGDWLTEKTSVRNIAEFAERVYRRHDLSGFRGDSRFAGDDRARKTFSKLRSSQAGVYAWRLQNAKSQAEREAMSSAADFAFRQAFALCPYSPEAVFRYVSLLLQFGRHDDALILAETCRKFDPSNGPISDVIQQLKSAKRTADVTRTEKSVHDSSLGDVQASLKAASTYLQQHQTNSALEVFDRLLKDPQVEANTILAIAQTFAQMGDLAKLESTLERLVQVTPKSPEGWYDLAAVRVTLGKNAEAIAALREAVKLSDLRRRQAPEARDLAVEVRRDPRFQPLRARPEYKEIVPAD